MRKIIAIIGPTATGKTDLALYLCRRFNGEIISVDSRQAYCGMEIGTGRFQDKKSKFKNQNGRLKIKNSGGEVPIHLCDFVKPNEGSNAFDYSNLAKDKIEEVWSKGKIPFLVGGTGFYLDIILGRRKLAGAGADRNLRRELEALNLKQLSERLGQLDRVKLSKIDIHNKYRLIRAIEIDSLNNSLSHPERSEGSDLDSSGRSPQNDDRSQNKGDVFIIGLSGENSYLYKKADQRVDKMIAVGLLGEIKNLVAKYGWEAPGLKTLGYREFRPYFEGGESLAAAVQKIKFNTHAYIRRQKTYFKKYFPDAAWFNIQASGFEEEAARKVESFLR